VTRSQDTGQEPPISVSRTIRSHFTLRSKIAFAASGSNAFDFPEPPSFTVPKE
jgi:hypothetical protein